MSKRIEGEADPRPMEKLISVLRNRMVDPESVYFRARKAAVEKAVKLQNRGDFPANDEMQLWTCEHDKKIQEVLTETRAKFGLAPYYKDNEEPTEN
jgi:hypothetical protein